MVGIIIYLAILGNERINSIKSRMQAVTSCNDTGWEPQRHNRLMQGISGLDTAINATIRGMYRDSVKTQEEYPAKNCRDSEDRADCQYMA